jgi:hypothetical protein
MYDVITTKNQLMVGALARPPSCKIKSGIFAGSAFIYIRKSGFRKNATFLIIRKISKK